MAAGRRSGHIIPVGGNKAPPRRQTQVAVEGIFQGTNWLQFVKRKKGRVGPDLASQLCATMRVVWSEEVTGGLETGFSS